MKKNIFLFIFYFFTFYSMAQKNQGVVYQHKDINAPEEVLGMVLQVGELIKFNKKISHLVNLQSITILGDGWIVIGSDNISLPPTIPYPIIDISEYIPDDLNQLKNLVVVSIFRVIHKLPIKITECVSLERLAIAYYKIQDIDEEIKKIKSLPNLKVIDFMLAILSEDEKIKIKHHFLNTHYKLVFLE